MTSSFSQTKTISKPFLSLQAGPLISVRPSRKRLAWTPIVTIDIPSTVKIDKGVSVNPLSKDKEVDARPSFADAGTDCRILDKGTSPSISISSSPEPPTNVVTQGPSISSSPGPSGLPSGSAAQPSSSLHPLSPSRDSDQDNDDSDVESEPESVILADPADPATELLSASEAFALLKSKIVDKYVEIKSEQKVVEKSAFQSAFEGVKPKTAPLRMTSAVKTRLAALDEEIVVKKSSSSSVTVFSPFLKSKDFKFYSTEIKPEFEAQTSVLASMAGVLDQARVKVFKKSKIAFKITELDSVL